MQFSLKLLLQPPSRSFYNPSAVSNMRAASRWTAQPPRPQGEWTLCFCVHVHTCCACIYVVQWHVVMFFRPLLNPVCLKCCSSTCIHSHCHSQTGFHPSSTDPELHSKDELSAALSFVVCVVHYEHITKLLIWMEAGSWHISCLSAVNIGTQTVGGRADMPGVARGSHYKYSSAVRNAQQVIPVPAHMTRLQVHIAAVMLHCLRQAGAV